MGQAVVYKANRDATSATAEFLMQRSTNTSWILDSSTKRIKLAHSDQLAPSSPLQASTPNVSRLTPKSTAVSDSRALVSPQLEVGLDATVPVSTTSEVPRRSERIKKQRFFLDYKGL